MKNPTTQSDRRTQRDAQRTNTVTYRKQIGGKTRPVKDRLQRTNGGGGERGSAMVDADIWLGKWHHLFLFSTSLSNVGSEIEKRKIAQTQSKNKKKKFLHSSFYSAWSCVFESIWFQPTDHFLSFATLTSTCYLYWKKTLLETLKGTKKARLHCHISTYNVGSLACSGYTYEIQLHPRESTVTLN